MKNLVCNTLLLVSALMLLSGGVFAADEVHSGNSTGGEIQEIVHGAEEVLHSLEGELAAAEHHGDEHKAGLPQMDVTWFPSQIFWLAVTFLSLYIIFSKKILPEISGTLENRREQIQGDLDSAQELKEQTEDVQKAYEEVLDEARKQSTELFESTQEYLTRKTAKKLDSFASSAQKKTKETELAIEESKVAAMGEMQTIAAEVASAAAEKIIGVTTDLDQAKTLVKNIGRKAA